MENKKQLAVDWLWDKIVLEGNTNYTDLLVVAKQMEKEQIVKAYNAYYSQEIFVTGEYLKGEQYYKETYEE